MFFLLSKLLPWVLSPAVWLVLLLILALVGRTPRQRLVGLRTVAVVTWLLTNPFLCNLAWLAWEVPATSLQQVGRYDVAILLTGITNQDKSPHDRVYIPRGSDRLLHTLLLYRTGRAPHILISGGSGRLIANGQSTEAQELRQLLLLSGVPDSVIVLEERSRNTRENAQFTGEVLRQHPRWQRRLLVTSGFHMRRAVGCFAKAGVAVRPFATDFYTTDVAYDPASMLLPSAASLALWAHLFHELAGYLMYKVAGYC